MSRVPATELEAYGARRYQSIKGRFGAKYTKDGRCYRPAIPLPFSQRQFVEWLDQIFRQGITKCFYCEWPISLEIAHFDHRMPVSQNGSLELWNLVPTCAACNQLKGAISEAGFFQLKELLLRLSPEDAADIRGRLQSQLKLARWKQSRLKAETVRIVPHRREAI